ncbi:MAG: hypothetical protein A3C80_02190 [Candidatus Ryanbacteria bacterium RIFCSPHIGHO2_02_FULL_45_43]|uniref:Cytochrome C biogenesis protein transmembrane domain-containing protein n=1 Tax=Candidatus Ryanbacteria bacterium RIFCSPHIGHO2_01_45_13 TaxID=1802112 RepID=A0A1G2FX70_9BACT|nr:MAG: hypothetical protein A2718_00620 [Candidatus Ryanbacteria bacterium RIFCSPHIGHO2_01_FULL_44_130]OGZ42417.1 MAG: hypothetical protein A2W41_03465 [Candidatus Ryanbacteria bacterium RIFCSPHIGHO2_01_45_13]OGZ48434.1 MAG: hypothetical protein A3C80_02190 [Candidatus Ryanbacteria bacterium RIFCSPHIGHO2_02_FULL_45_43]OGZ50299.1 MAG: hypothetical protein A3E55_00090 [Candidatus Ryanbacteria bacterium RIFCSPHIGHO2_12_FULL_44_20]OGZ51638.1 MAG: hypothetical protein A3A17_02540 [Candidatus Ryanba
MFGDELTLGIVITAALADSINPCVFGALIFLIAFMTRVFRSRKMMLLGGLLYTLVVYATYLTLGFGVINITRSIGISAWFYFIVAVIAILAGLLEIKDYFWYGKGFSLQMIPGGAERMKLYTRKIEMMERQSPTLMMLTTAALGVFVVLIELPCTGAPYFAILGLLQRGSYDVAVPLLLLYNFVFIVPLLFIVGVSYFGATSEQLESWRKKHRGLMRLGVGFFLMALGAIMLYSAPLPF